MPKVLFVLRAATVPRSTEILPLGFDWVTLLIVTSHQDPETGRGIEPQLVCDLTPFFMLKSHQNAKKR